MIFTYYFVMRAVLNLGTLFSLIILFLFSFILTSIKENFLVYSHHHLLRRLSSSIENFFTASKMPLSQPILNKAPNEAFSSAAAFQVSTSKVLEPVKSLPTAEIVDKDLKVNSCEFDVSLYREKVKGLNTAQISNLIKNVFKPEKQFPFPKTNGRSFRYNWLDLYPWLCYSPLKDGGYCLSCVLFGDRFPGKASKLKNLFSEPFRRWNDASTSFKRHAGHGTGGEMGLHACTFPDTESRKTKLVDVCRTRWVDRVQGLDTFQELFVPLYRTLEEMNENEGNKYVPALVTEAVSCLANVSNFDFLMTLIITRHILDSTLSVTQLMQGKSIDIMDGIHLITTLKNSAVKIRNSVDATHDAWYDEALQLAKEVDIEESKPCPTPRNKPSKTISDYYKIDVTISLLDHLQSSLDRRFDLDSINVYKGLSIVPVKMLSLIKKGIDWKEQFKTAANFYHDDLPNPLALDAELFQWQIYWETFIGPHPDNIATTLKAISFDGFENIKIILHILGTLPITSCECKRSISALRSLKNYKRSTMVEERLNGLALMQIHREIPPDFEKIINKFADENTRLKFN